MKDMKLSPSELKRNAREAWLRRSECYWNSKTFPKFNTRIGDIYEIDFGENIGTEFSGRHLAICLSNTLPNQERVLVVPLTTKYVEYNINPSDVITVKSYTGTLIKAGVVLNEVRWLSKIRVFKQSLILREEATEKLNITKAHININRKQFSRWRSL